MLRSKIVPIKSHSGTGIEQVFTLAVLCLLTPSLLHSHLCYKQTLMELETTFLPKIWVSGIYLFIFICI